MFKKVLISTLAASALITSLHASKSTPEELSKQQKDTLFFIYQEEKVARDAYITLGGYYPHNTFENIQLSEQEHIDAVQALCEKYGVDISAVNEDIIGEFELPVLQELYDTLVAQGQVSELSALMVGEYIELTDIDDLEEAEEGMPSDVVRVFENLKNGSLNHLDAFRSAIEAAE
jgi:hypothetical protein